ncbi:unnamed protein product [Vicia faba]|uniref:SNF2 N-terminal domain-containing protein n=1 Tax=Vicia faba TaxID=3906 RepID=A0AAV1AD62_VICFA|nr:unnamed protein product [Vicia faba]
MKKLRDSLLLKHWPFSKMDKASISKDAIVVVDRFPNGSGKRALSNNSVNVSPFDRSQFNVSDGGNINLHDLKYAIFREDGCIISHAPRTGKTRLTIVFLMAYLKLFPKCHPVIVTPASLLLTWEDAFKKWDIGVPFHKQS